MTDELKNAMISYAPAIAEDYKRYVRRIFAEIVRDLGPTLKGVYNSWKWAKTFSSIQSSIRSETLYSEKFLDNGLLVKNAKRYSVDTALSWYYKMTIKLGPLESVKVSPPDPSGEVIINGRYKGHTVTVYQHPIINVSSRGLLFHQFPARIYIDSKSVSEAAYKKLLHIDNSPNP